jgi:hypothetical protein
MRRSFPREVETAVLVRSVRRCALCFGFHGDLRKKSGQLAHVDRNPANSALENAAFLCTVHHDEYDSIPSQTKRITPDELIAYREALYEAVKTPGVLREIESKRINRSRRGRTAGIVLEVYDRRIPIYKATVEFLRSVNADLRPDLQAVVKFGRDTDEALFLFDETIVSYLSEIATKAFRLRAASQALQHAFTESASQEVLELSIWFHHQFAETRRIFAPFLRLVA